MADSPSKTKRENNQPIESKFKEPLRRKRLQLSTTESLKSTTRRNANKACNKAQNNRKRSPHIPYRNRGDTQI